MQASRTRHWVIVFAVVLSIITYIDRVSISFAGPAMREDLNLTPAQFGWVLAVFAWAYALFEIPGGWMGDKWGARSVLSRIVLWWSFFTAATGWAMNYTYLLVVRALFGAGEAGAFPNITKMFSTWLPGPEKSRAQGIVWMSARWGGAFTPLLMAALFRAIDWRTAFQIFGALGVLWTAVFYFWYRNSPREHKDVNAAEIAVIGDSLKMAEEHGETPWGRFATSRSTWLLWTQYFLLSYGWYFYITWFPTYLKESLKYDLKAGGALLSGMPLFLGGIGCLVSGFVTPKLGAYLNDIRRARKIVAVGGMTMAGILLLIAMQLREPLIIVGVIAMASFCNDLVMPPAWNTCMDVGGKFAGTLSGSMNMMGNFAGGIAPVVIGNVLEATGNDFTVTFYISAAAYFLGALCWLGIDSTKRLDKEI
ncbi:MFS transporter [Bryobacter aggregatus]|uniref:MFS transporter n=1 Tax=Bryobacter aggregatus TaxID=360054 RepID=UPI00068B9B5E|nr:MFS transporter [Bryobacter aggregatus]